MTKATNPHVECRKQLKRSPLFDRSSPKPDAGVRLSGSGAVRAMHQLSLDGQGMLFAMMRFTSTKEGDRFVLGDAATAAGLEPTRARAGVNEMMACGLITTEPDGHVLLHPVFSDIGLHLRSKVSNDNSNGCQVVQFATTEARG